jgi:AcrR family transcriptional regulator
MHWKVSENKICFFKKPVLILTERSIKNNMSPRTPQQFREIREEKMALIMDVALEHFSNVGFHATTISHIARHAGISKGLMYNYFKSKEELLASILNRSLTDIYSDFDSDRDGHLSGDELEEFIRKVFDILRKQRSFWKLLYRIILQPGVYEDLFDNKQSSVNISGTPLKEFSQNMMAMMVDFFNMKKKISGDDYDPETEMFMFLNTVKGFALTYVLAEEYYPQDYFDKMIDALIKKYK